MRQHIRELKRKFPFARIETANSGHLRIVLPNGKVVIASSTPSCAPDNVRRDVRRGMTGRDRNDGAGAR